MINKKCEVGTHPILAGERPKRDSLPFLDVPGTPVIHENHAKKVVRGFCCADCTAQLIARTNEGCLATGQDALS